MTTLSELTQSAGLLPVTQAVIVPNYIFPVLRLTSSGAAKIQREPMTCSSTSPAALTVLYFSLPGCENCRPGLLSMQALAQASVESQQPVCLRIVVSDWPTRDEIVQELREVGWQGHLGVIWDKNGAISERLAVLGQPALYLLDRNGQVFAYQNGPVEFAAPGFKVYWATLLNLIKNEASRHESRTFSEILTAQESVLKSSSTVMFLNNGVLSFVWLVAGIGLCYSLTRFFLRHRKNFTRSEK